MPQQEKISDPSGRKGCIRIEHALLVTESPDRPPRAGLVGQTLFPKLLEIKYSILLSLHHSWEVLLLCTV
jgi:hypothetical protein